MTYSVQRGRVKHLQSPVVGSKTGVLPMKTNAGIIKCCFCLCSLLQSEYKCQTVFSASLCDYPGLKKNHQKQTNKQKTNYGGNNRKYLDRNCRYGLINWKSLSKDILKKKHIPALVFVAFQKMPISQFASGIQFGGCCHCSAQQPLAVIITGLTTLLIAPELLHGHS